MMSKSLIKIVRMRRKGMSGCRLVSGQCGRAPWAGAIVFLLFLSPRIDPRIANLLLRAEDGSAKAPVRKRGQFIFYLQVFLRGLDAEQKTRYDFNNQS